jgi:hypothetical protein
MNVTITATVTYEIEEVDSIHDALSIFDQAVMPDPTLDGVCLTSVKIETANKEREMF